MHWLLLQHSSPDGILLVDLEDGEARVIGTAGEGDRKTRSGRPVTAKHREDYVDGELEQLFLKYRWIHCFGGSSDEMNSSF